MFAGSLVAIVTPMRADGAVDFEAWARLLDFHASNGTQGIVVGGTTGESATLSDEELRELSVRACAQLKRRLAVIVGAGSSSTAATVERVRWLSELPIDALLLVTPAYNRPSQEGLYQHFCAAAAAAARPLLLYNVPARTAVDLKPATVARLAQQAQIVGIKEAVPECSRVRELVALTPGAFAVLSGDDATARTAILAGARGVISVTANVAPRAMSEMVAAARAREEGRAAQLDEPLSALHGELFVEANPIPVKWLLMQMGLIGPGIRLPLTPLAVEHQAGVARAARAAGVLPATAGATP
ncbi:MAG TPA: 4-hydroxy-tetrahydrodipicolinate synthase [Steroidobacteraceae bacterium]|nr:4-hydroxy-tetrahydrodipicolinate synthase [Steroidobacteraceae bacterium]